MVAAQTWTMLIKAAPARGFALADTGRDFNGLGSENCAGTADFRHHAEQFHCLVSSTHTISAAFVAGDIYQKPGSRLICV